MDGFKEFQGKDLDSAIAEACDYFDAPRERLEIEIVQDAKTGIFGIVGARKAKVRARRAQLREAVESVLGPRGTRRTDTAPLANDSRHETQPESEERPTPKKVRGSRHPAKAAPRPKPAAATARRAAPSAPSALKAPGDQAAPTPPAHSASPAHAPEPPHSPDPDPDDAPEGLPRTPLEELDLQRLQSLTEEMVKELVRPITGGHVPVSVRVEDGRVRANVDWSGDAGLLIGREGQTLAALQYLASRMVSHSMNAAVRVQLDIGEYRLRQDEKLRSLALSLAKKARATGRAYSTRPLSSYHRRIIHLCLQDAEDLQTRSSGEGPLKRVIISLRKPEDA